LRIDEDYKLVHCLLGFQSVHGAKSAHTTREITARVINDFKIGQDIGAFMIDSARGILREAHFLRTEIGLFAKS
jgi:hypothetical protein